MKLTALLVALAVLALFGVLDVLTSRKRKRGSTPLVARPPLSEREQSMFFRLATTFPEHVVLAQVAFSSLLEAKDRPTRNTFDRKVADFVLCTKAFVPVAVIELDDSSHRGREKRDAQRDALLAQAGYRVIRFPNVPDADKLKATLAAAGS